MAKIYYGNILERGGSVYPKNNMRDVIFTTTCKENAILIEIEENKFIDFDDLVLGKTQVLNVYAFNMGDKYVDPSSLIDVAELLEQKQKVK